MSIAEFSTEDLARELVTRPDILRPDGLCNPAVWALRKALGKIVCVDSTAFRFCAHNKFLEVLGIRRKTGPYPSKLCLVGGVIAREESIEEAVRRHWRTDLGCEITLVTPWYQPVCVHQDMPPAPDGSVRPDFNPEPTKWNIGVVHIVRIVGNQEFQFGSTELGGQEAYGVEWLSLNTLPGESEFAYGFRGIFQCCLEYLRDLK